MWARSAHLEPSPGALWLLCRHGQSNLPPAGGEIPPAHNKRNPKPVPSSVTASPCHLPPRGKAYGRPHGAAPTKFKGTSGFAVGADDLGGPRAHAVRPYRPIGMFQGGRVRAPAPTAYPKVRLIFCRARCPHRAVSGRPGVPPLRNKRKYT